MLPRPQRCSPVFVVSFLLGLKPLLVGMAKYLFWPMKYEWRWYASLQGRNVEKPVGDSPSSLQWMLVVPLPDPLCWLVHLHPRCYESWGSYSSQLSLLSRTKSTTSEARSPNWPWVSYLTSLSLSLFLKEPLPHNVDMSIKWIVHVRPL